MISQRSNLQCAGSACTWTEGSPSDVTSLNDATGLRTSPGISEAWLTPSMDHQRTHFERRRWPASYPLPCMGLRYGTAAEPAQPKTDLKQAKNRSVQDWDGT